MEATVKPTVSQTERNQGFSPEQLEKELLFPEMRKTIGEIDLKYTKRLITTIFHCDVVF